MQFRRLRCQGATFPGAFATAPVRELFVLAAVFYVVCAEPTVRNRIVQNHAGPGIAAEALCEWSLDSERKLPDAILTLELYALFDHFRTLAWGYLASLAAYGDN
jgi:hypothetical protein